MSQSYSVGDRVYCVRFDKTIIEATILQATRPILVGQLGSSIKIVADLPSIHDTLDAAKKYAKETDISELHNLIARLTHEIDTLSDIRTNSVKKLAALQKSVV